MPVRKLSPTRKSGAAPSPVKDNGIDVQNLSIVRVQGLVPIVQDVSFSVAPGEVLGLVGESGSGKTTVALALLAYARRGLRITGGTVKIGGVSMFDLDANELAAMRGKEVAYVPQDPATALHPGLRVRTQLAECLREFPAIKPGRLFEMLEEVSLPATNTILDSYPHELSGGQQQRIAIAMAFAARPVAIVMDEPTTALDVTSQAHVLRTVSDLCARHRAAALYVSHDLAVIATVAQRVAVMYAGEIVEAGKTSDVLRRPVHPYTKALIGAVPDPDGQAVLRGLPGHAPDPELRAAGCSFAPRCSLALPACSDAPPAEMAIATTWTVRCSRAGFAAAQVSPVLMAPDQRPVPARTAAPLLRIENVNAWHARQVLHDISLEISPGQCLALIGESGSGKTTLARAIAGLHARWSGEIEFMGAPLSPVSHRRSAATLRRIQYIFQNPYASFNPQRTLGQSVGIAAKQLLEEKPNQIRDRIRDVFESVGLPKRFMDLYPNQISGGQRQRAAIARGLICEPYLLICDEVTSALDVSIQAMIIELLVKLREERGLSVLFVAHNIGLVRSIAHDVAVMQSGRIVEFGTVASIFDNPVSDETKRLIRDAPRFNTKIASTI